MKKHIHGDGNQAMCGLASPSNGFFESEIATCKGCLDTDIYDDDQLEWLFNEEHGGRTFSPQTKAKMERSSKVLFDRKMAVLLTPTALLEDWRE